MNMKIYLNKAKRQTIQDQILIIDSEWNILKLLYALLSPNYHLVVKESSFDAIHWLEKSPKPSLIITEFDLPYINGALLVTYLKSSGIYNNIPVIILSDVEELKAKTHELPLSSGAIISKPFDPSYLTFKINSLINERKLAIA